MAVSCRLGSYCHNCHQLIIILCERELKHTVCVHYLVVHPKWLQTFHHRSSFFTKCCKLRRPLNHTLMHFCRIKALNLILIHLVKQFLRLKTEARHSGFFFRLDKCYGSSINNGGLRNGSSRFCIISCRRSSAKFFMLIEKHKLFTQT